VVWGLDEKRVQRLGLAHLCDERIGDFTCLEGAIADAVADACDPEICEVGHAFNSWIPAGAGMIE
jgi:hypothetical protein